jgi:hypothetical protein
LERTERIVERLPEFYRAWDPDSVIYKLLDAVGRVLNEAQKDLFDTMKLHWVDTAYLTNLDRLGSIFDVSRKHGEPDEEYRARIKKSIRQFKGGGTRDAVLTFTSAFLGLEGPGAIELVENPPVHLAVKRSMSTGDSWTVGSMSVDDATPRMEVTLEGGGDRVLNPRWTDAKTGESITYQGTMRLGQKLTLENRTALLDGVDASSSVAATAPLVLLRSGTTLDYKEEVSAKIARFDRGAFDESIFEIPVPNAVVKLDWSGRTPATFELTISAASLSEKGVSKEDVESFLNLIKGAGIVATVRTKEQ